MEKSILERSQLRSLTDDSNRKEKIDSELTDSPNFIELQRNVNDRLADPARAELGNSSTQTVRPITNDTNDVFENLQVGGASAVDATLKAFELHNKKKILTQSMMDIALLSANANHLKDLLNNFDRRSVSYVCLVLLSMSIILQVLVSITILLSIRYNVTNAEERKMAISYSHYVLVGTFLITVINILIPEFRML